MLIAIFVLAALILGLLIGALWMPKTFNIEKSVVVDRPVPSVMDHVADLNNYSKWNPWQQVDKAARITITGTPMTPGHRYEWNGPKVGSGHLTLRDIDDRHIHLDLQFIKPFKSLAKDNWLFEPWGDNSTKVTWQNSGNLPWPVQRLVGPMMTKSLNKQFEQGLKNLKALCEGRATTPAGTNDPA